MASPSRTGTPSTIVGCPSCRTRNRVPVAARGTPRCASCRTPLPWLVEADDATFAEAVDTRVPVLVDLWASWCGPCRTLAPVVEQLSVDRAGRLKVVKIDVERAPAVAGRMGVQAIPTLVLLSGGTEVARQVGALPPDQLTTWVESALAAR